MNDDKKISKKKKILPFSYFGFSILPSINIIELYSTVFKHLNKVRNSPNCGKFKCLPYFLYMLKHIDFGCISLFLHMFLK